MEKAEKIASRVNLAAFIAGLSLCVAASMRLGIRGAAVADTLAGIGAIVAIASGIAWICFVKRTKREPTTFVVVAVVLGTFVTLMSVSHAPRRWWNRCVQVCTRAKKVGTKGCGSSREHQVMAVA